MKVLKINLKRKSKLEVKVMKVPLYQEVYQKIKHLIRTGEYEVGDFLPPESELEEQYGVSRTTIRKVITMLVTEGYVEVKQGRGTSVLDFNSSQQLNMISSITETLRKRGMDVRAETVYIEVVRVTGKTAEKLELDDDAEVYRIQRVMLADDVPIAIMENYIRCELAPGIQKEFKEDHSLYHFLEDKYGLHIENAKDIISAKSAELSESRILNVRAGAALLTLRRVTYTQGHPLTYDRITVRADKYQFEIESKDLN